MKIEKMKTRCDIFRKTVSVWIVVVLSGTALVQAGVISFDKLQAMDGVYFHPETNVPYTGVVDMPSGDEWYSDALSAMKDGLFHGKFVGYDIEYYTTGHYKDGAMHGKWVWYDGDGLNRICTYKNNKIYETLIIGKSGWKLLDQNGKPVVGNSVAQTAKHQIGQLRSFIDQYKQQFAQCGSQKSDSCAAILYKLGNVYSGYANFYAISEGKTKPDNSMMIQTYQRLIQEYPTSQYSQIANRELSNIKIMSLPIEKRQAALGQRTIEQLELQITGCDVYRNYECAEDMFTLGMAYFQLTNGHTTWSNRDYFKAKQIFQRLVDEYPNSMYLSGVKYMLTEIEIVSLPPERQQAAREQRIKLEEAERAQQTVKRIMEAYKQPIEAMKQEIMECEVRKNEQCAEILYKLGGNYFNMAYYVAANGVVGDYSMAIQTYQRIVNEYPNSMLSSAAKNMLTNIETMKKKVNK